MHSPLITHAGGEAISCVGRQNGKISKQQVICGLVCTESALVGTQWVNCLLYSHCGPRLLAESLQEKECPIIIGLLAPVGRHVQQPDLLQGRHKYKFAGCQLSFPLRYQVRSSTSSLMMHRCGSLVVTLATGMVQTGSSAATSPLSLSYISRVH
ncbi:unnamed protein product [Pleuronectes platessa]|uniref:Uncharacterized protein n=1 Tax=Pleuronectes platessa TaxID=8262 RepID=A0A9N7UYR1_PLEPL|nr:unnamed protein product [Pleuronectes platessa]